MLSFVGAAFLVSSCDEDILGGLSDALSEGDTAAALKEALKVGAQTAATNLGQKDGYFGDAMVKIGMPKEVATAAELLSTEAGKTFLSAAGASNMEPDKIVELMNRAAETAENVMLLGAHDAAGLLGAFHQQFSVNGLDGIHIHHTDGNALGRELFGRLKRLMHHKTASYDCNILALCQLNAFSDFELVFVLVE